MSGGLAPRVPGAFVPLLEENALGHIAFLARKESLGQDALLLERSPSSYPALIVKRFAQMALREVEHVSLSPTVRENDLKQHREFRSGSVVWVDDAAVRAALNGRILLLEGLERCEPNVLPLLNSLLEQREMMLEDGRLVVSSVRFQELLRSGKAESRAALERSGIIECHPSFRVVGIARPGLGTPLDPPLRSRLQGHFVTPPSLEQLGAALSVVYGDHAAFKAANAWKSVATATGKDIPFTLAYAVAQRLSSEPAASVAEVVSHYFTEETSAGLNVFELLDEKKADAPSLEDGVLKELSLRRGAAICGAKGSGRRYAALRVADKLGLKVETSLVGPDQSERDLFAMRTGSKEETQWADSPLVVAARHGKLCVIEVLDGAAPSLLHALEGIARGDPIVLPSGDTLVSAEHYEELAAEHSASMLRDEMKISSMHQSFRLLLIHGPHNANSSSPWLSSFSFPVFNVAADPAVLESAVARAVPESASSLAHLLRQFAEKLLAPTKVSHRPADLRVSFSIANAITCAKLAVYAGASPADVIRNAMLFQFLKPSHRQAVDGFLKECRLDSWKFDQDAKKKSWTLPEALSEDEKLIPHVAHKFSSHPSAQKTLEKTIFSYWTLNLPLVLVGLQGTAKNLLVDYACQIKKLPRGYIQLHADTTVSSLFLQRTVEAGKILVKESPLVTAIRKGHVCVLDEVDKAPPVVLSTIRMLAGGLLRLPDQRVVVSKEMERFIESSGENVIQIHPNFRLVLLANPGVFPFLGNNVLDSLAEMCPVVLDPPSAADMASVLKSYGPNVQPETIVQLSKSFAALFSAHLNTDISFPYGLREAISVVKDLNTKASLDAALANVFDYETEPKIRGKIADIFAKNGLNMEQVFVSAPGYAVEQSKKRLEHNYMPQRPSDENPKPGKDPDGKPHVGGNTWAGGTGGSSTAGMGGRHGPWRRDGGFEIHQVPESEKRWTDLQAQDRARQMAKEALEKRLEEINMGKMDYAVYEKYLGRIMPQIEQLKALVKSLRPGKSSKWLRALGDGVLDDSKLVEGMAGEANIFKRLAKDKETPFGAGGKMHIRFVFDCSASMYRFNGWDRRLERELECALMVLEGFADADPNRLEFSMVGHSGDSKCVALWPEDGRKPSNLKERYQVLEKVVSSTQFTWSGDTTMAALEDAIRFMATLPKETDKKVFLFSDANFARYGLSARELSDLLTMDKHVDATAMFIGTLGEEAEELQSSLPRDKAFVCLKTEDLPNILHKQLQQKITRYHL